MPILLPISQLGNPVLRKIAIEVGDIRNSVVSSFVIQSLIKDMIQTCQAVDGVGIAAPQVFQSIRLFIIASKPNPRYPNAPDMEPTAIINPKIISCSDEKEMDWEGCLSVPGIRGQVSRHKSVTVSFTNRRGQQQERTFDDFLARVFQHEYDHLDGIVFTDRADPKSFITDREYEKMVNATPEK